MGSSGKLITSDQILDGTIATADLAPNAVSQAQSQTAGSNAQTSSTTMVGVADDIGGTMAITLTVTGGPVLLGFSAVATNLSTGGVNAVGFMVAGTLVSDLLAYTAAAGGQFSSHSVVYLAVGVPAGSRVFAPVWRVNSGTASAYGRTFWAVELKR